jgi:hypothetical protein
MAERRQTERSSPTDVSPNRDVDPFEMSESQDDYLQNIDDPIFSTPQSDDVLSYLSTNGQAIAELGQFEDNNVAVSVQKLNLSFDPLSLSLTPEEIGYSSHQTFFLFTDTVI